MNAHLAGRPVSVWTYRHHGCRCHECREASNERMRQDRARAGGQTQADRRQVIAMNLAVAWVRREYPDQWRRFLDEARQRQEAAQ